MNKNYFSEENTQGYSTELLEKMNNRMIELGYDGDDQSYRALEEWKELSFRVIDEFFKESIDESAVVVETFDYASSTSRDALNACNELIGWDYKIAKEKFDKFEDCIQQQIIAHVTFRDQNNRVIRF